MFYSHEILTSREYGVATIWLVATLGSKSNTKKVTRKAILDVDVKKACNTISEPAVPMALRLSSNLLYIYGVSKVYDQQCSYVLADAQVAQNNMRALLKVMQSKDLDQAVGTVRRDHLMLPDDPAFIPEMAMPPLDFDISMIDAPLGNSQHSSQFLKSPGHHLSSASSHGASLPSIRIPSSVGSYQLPPNDFLAGSSAQKLGGVGRDLIDDEQNLFQDDMDFEFDADGNLVDISPEERDARRAGSLVRPGSDNATRMDLHKELINARRQGVSSAENGAKVEINFGDDQALILPDAEPFPVMSGALRNASVAMPSEEESSDTAEAPLRHYKPRARKLLENDQALVLANSMLAQLQHDYTTNQQLAKRVKIQHKAAIQAKRNAEWMVMSSGLGGVGTSLDPSVQLISPLADYFSGPALLARITGQPVPPQSQRNKRSVPVPAEGQITPKRPRNSQEEVEQGLNLNTNLNGEDGALLPPPSSIEHPRDAPSALRDHPSSAAMPWNVSASINSHASKLSRQAGLFSGPNSQQGTSQLGLSRRGGVAESPLLGRGSAMHGKLEQFSQAQDMDIDKAIMYERSDDDVLLFGGDRNPRDLSNADAEFELFGQAAGVDTQTAAQSQWVRQALDREADNFLDFVINSIAEQGVDMDDEADELATGNGTAEPGRKALLFERLFEPKANSAVVAAQAFYHVLSLATKGALWVEQEVELVGTRRDPQAFGAIWLGCY